MPFSYSRLIIGLVVGCAVLVFVGIAQMLQKKPKNDALVLMLKLAGGIGIAGGLFTGTLISHGVDVPWYLFGAVIALCAYVSSAILVLVWRRPSNPVEKKGGS